MPLYTFHINSVNTEQAKQQTFAKNIATLHVQTFGTDSDAVRIDFVYFRDSHEYVKDLIGLQSPKIKRSRNLTRETKGDYGYQPAQGL